MYKTLLNKHSSQFTHLDDFTKNNKQLKLHYDGSGSQLIVKGDLYGRVFEHKIELFFKKLGYQLKRKEFIDVFLEISDTDEDGIIAIYMLLQQLENFSHPHKTINLFWNTLGNKKIFQLAMGFESKIRCEIFSVGNFSNGNLFPFHSKQV